MYKIIPLLWIQKNAKIINLYTKIYGIYILFNNILKYIVIKRRKKSNYNQSCKTSYLPTGMIFHYQFFKRRKKKTLTYLILNIYD